MPTFVVGDVHGELDKLRALLSDAGLLSPGRTWAGGDAELWCIGDFTDRGPDGVGVLDLVMRLEREAAERGGGVHAVLGNHEAMLMAAHRFGTTSFPGLSATFLEFWALNGGRDEDLARLREEHIAWISGLPSMALVGSDLLVHADATCYVRYGRTREDVNAGIAAVLRSDDVRAWAVLLDDMAERHAFERDADVARRFLALYGGTRIVHGHTPIPFVLDIPAEEVTGAHVYADGLCVNVDGGMFAGGPGFVWRPDA